MQQFRHFVFTWNNYEESGSLWQYRLHSVFDNVINANYFVYGYEVGEKGTPHLQGYVQLSKRKTFNTLKEALPSGIHFEPAKGSSEDCITYCKKSGEFTEKGELRTIARGRAKQAKDWQIIIEKAAAGKLDEIRDENPREYIIYYKTLKSLAIDNIISEAQDRRCLWIYGEPGTGKSRACHKLFGDAYWKNGNKWWDGYQGEYTVILDDLDTPALYGYLKRWADRYKVLGEVKGSAISLNYGQFVVTSNFSPDQLGNQDVGISPLTIEAIQRRFLVLKAVRWNSEVDDLLVVDPLSTCLLGTEQLPVRLMWVLSEEGWVLDPVKDELEGFDTNKELDQ